MVYTQNYLIPYNLQKFDFNLNFLSSNKFFGILGSNLKNSDPILILNPHILSTLLRESFLYFYHYGILLLFVFPLNYHLEILTIFFL
jgi:hypothetical protein